MHSKNISHKSDIYSRNWDVVVVGAGAAGSFRGSCNSYESPAIVPNPFNQYRPTEPPTIVVNSGGNPLNSFFCGRSVRG